MSVRLPIQDFTSRVNLQIKGIFEDVRVSGLFSSLEVIVAYLENGNPNIEIECRRNMSIRTLCSSVENMISDKIGQSTSFGRLTSNERVNLCEDLTVDLKYLLEKEISNVLCFIGFAKIVDEYLLVPILNLDKNTLGEVASVVDKSSPFRRLGDRRCEETSFAHELGFSVSNKVSETLPYLKDGSAQLSGIKSAIFRRAARELMKQPVYHTGASNVGNYLADRLYTDISEVSRLTYENSESTGLVVFKERKAGGSYGVKFDPTVPMLNHRRFRKLLETSNDNLVLLADEGVVYVNQTLESLNSTKESESSNIPEGHYAIDFKGGHEWDLCFGNQALMSVIQDRPRLPRRRLEEGEFKEKVGSVFSSADENKLWEIVNQAIRQPHGTMIVVTSEAESEAERLRKESMKIHPTELSKKHILGLTSIDGSLMTDPEGTCTAIGVILDGESKEGNGDPSRGARHNAALRYYETRRQKSGVECMIVTVSEDGGVSILPK